MYAPADGYVINLQLRPGSWVVAIPFAPAMSFVEEEYQVIALYHQNELHQVAPGNEAEIALITQPGEIIKAHVNSIVWAQGQGQLPMSGVVPQTGTQPLPPGRFAVKLDIDPKFRDEFLAAGAVGQGAIYTERLARDPHPAQGDPARRLVHQLPHSQAALMNAGEDSRGCVQQPVHRARGGAWLQAVARSSRCRAANCASRRWNMSRRRIAGVRLRARSPARCATTG